MALLEMLPISLCCQGPIICVDYYDNLSLSDEQLSIYELEQNLSLYQGVFFCLVFYTTNIMLT